MNIYNSLIFKIIPKSYTAITLGPVILYRSSKPSFKVRNHEFIHRQQWVEMLLITLIPCMILGGWWNVIPFIAFYIWYVIEYLISVIYNKFLKQYNQNRSYHSIAMEMEAYDHEFNTRYLVDRKAFEWIKYLGKL